MIIYQKLYKLGDDYILIIPDEEVERLNLSEGQQIGFRIDPIDAAHIPDDEKEAFERSLKRSEEAYRYLSGR